jgi:uncharacterized protein YndB with AHSA1/START domain
MTRYTTSRHFDATRAAVFAAFEAPERLATWWGPDGFHSSFELFECRTGGHWRFTMHAPDGKDYPNECTFLAIEPDRRIVVRHLSWPHFVLTIGLEDDGPGMLVTWDQAFDDPEVAASLQPIVEPANEQNLNRWQAVVAKGAHGGG